MTDPDRRYRPVADLEPMELIPLVGAGASLSQLREVGTSLRNGFALQRLIEGRWTVTGYVGTEARAVDWVVNGNPAY